MIIVLSMKARLYVVINLGAVDGVNGDAMPLYLKHLVQVLVMAMD